MGHVFNYSIQVTAFERRRQEAIGHGIRAKRSKSGAVSFDLLEIADAAL